MLKIKSNEWSAQKQLELSIHQQTVIKLHVSCTDPVQAIFDGAPVKTGTEWAMSFNVPPGLFELKSKSVFGCKLQMSSVQTGEPFTDEVVVAAAVEGNALAQMRARVRRESHEQRLALMEQGMLGGYEIDDDDTRFEEDMAKDASQANSPNLSKQPDDG